MTPATLKRLPFLAAAENRKTFLRRISLLFPTFDPRYQAIERAYNYAKDAFRGKSRESGERYFEHVRAVTLIVIDYLRVKDYRIIIAAILHDLVEDIPSWTVERVSREFGEYVALLVEYLSKPPKSFGTKAERDHAYHGRFDAAPREFFLLKLADRWHNTLTLRSCSKEKRERKIAETREHYLPHAEKHLILYHELTEAIEFAQSAP